MPKSANKGKVFEEEFKKSCEKQGLWIERIKDNQLSYSTKFNTSTNKYDFHVFDGEILYGVELKRTHLNALTVSRDIKLDSSKMIKLHQLKALAQDGAYQNIIGVLLLDFQTSGQTYLLTIDSFMEWYNNSDKQSINEKDIINLSPVLVDKELKRVHYTYYMDKAFKELKDIYKNNH